MHYYYYCAQDGDESDMADWLINWLASPSKMLKKQLSSSASKSNLLQSASSVDLSKVGVPRTTKELADAWRNSEACAKREMQDKANKV